MKSLRLIHALGRCGSTLVAACLSSMDRVVILNEVHPGQSVFHPVDQAQNYNLFDETETDRVRNLPFAEQISEIDKKGESKGLLLVVREWSFIDFEHEPWTFSSLLTACQAHFDQIFRAYLVRDPIDQWVSFRAFGCTPELDDLPHFMKIYRTFAEHAQNGRYLKYEDLTRSPRAILARLCSLLHLPYTDVGDAWRTSEHLSGDVPALRAHSAIVPHPAKAVPADVLAVLAECEDYHLACQLLGYPARTS